MIEKLRLLQDFFEQALDFAREHITDKRVDLDLKEIRISFDLIITDYDPKPGTEKSILERVLKK